MPELEKLRKNAQNQVADALLIKETDTDALLEAALADYQKLLSLSPDDPEAVFNTVFIPAYLKRDKPNEREDELKCVVNATNAYVDSLISLTMTEEQYAEVLTALQLRLEHLVRAYVEHSYLNYFYTRLALKVTLGEANDLGASLAYEAAKGALENLSLELMKESFAYPTSFITAINRMNTDVKYYCVAMLAKTFVECMVDIPAFAYESPDSNFYKSSLPCFLQTVNVAKTSDPHAVYYVPMPKKRAFCCYDSLDNWLEEQIPKSELYQIITKLNKEAKEEAIQRYWQTHPDEQKELLKKKEKMKIKCSEIESELSQSKCVISAAKVKRDKALAPKSEEISKRETEIKELERQLLNAGIFAFKRKRELRCTIEESKTTLSVLKSEHDVLKKQVDELYAEETKDADTVLLTTKLNNTKRQLEKVNAKLACPIEA